MINTRGTCHVLPNGQKLMILEINGQKAFSMLSDTGSCHEAGYLAMEVGSLWAKALRIPNPVIRSTSQLAVNQMNDVFKAREPAMRTRRDALRRLTKGMNVTFVY